MTPEQVRELREAAETEMKFSAEACPPDHPLCKFYEVVRLRHRMLAQYVLTTVHADDALPVTADWLREEWGATIKPPCIGIREFIVNTEGRKLFGLIYSDGSVSVWQISNCTRHQFRQLAGILGIQPKK